MSVSASGAVGYTADVTSATAGGTGVAQVEVDDYDAFYDYVNSPSTTPASHLIKYRPAAMSERAAGKAARRESANTSTLTPDFIFLEHFPDAPHPRRRARRSGKLSRPKLASPTLTLFDSTGKVIATNTGWGNAPASGNSSVAAEIQPATTAIMNSVYASTIASGSADSAMVVTLPANTGYTAEVTSANGSSAGIALVEVYSVP